MPDTQPQKVYMASRAATISKFFPGSLDVHDYVQRLDIALQAYGFDGNNSIGASTLWYTCHQPHTHHSHDQPVPRRDHCHAQARN